MTDGKVCNVVISALSAMRCYICNATSQEFNNLEGMQELKVNESKLDYGLSTLHRFLIRFFKTPCARLEFRSLICYGSEDYDLRTLSPLCAGLDLRTRLLARGST